MAAVEQIEAGVEPALEPKIVCRDVDVFYGDKQALTSVNLDIISNQVTSLIGPSGCGKSDFSALPQPDERRDRGLPGGRPDHTG